MRSYPGFCRSKQLEYNPGLTHRRRAGHPRANRRTSDRPSFCGVRPSCSRVIMSCHIFQSTHPLRGATRRSGGDRVLPLISIHAPLAGCDLQVRQGLPAFRDFNPRTPCGVRLETRMRVSKPIKFQSTHPLRGATITRTPARRGHGISIHAPLAGCDMERLTKRLDNGISIHAPLAGCDCSSRRTSACATKFQSTHPLRGATGRGIFEPAQLRISIHAPLAGCDYRA